MSTKQKQVLSIKEKQIIISHWDKKEKGTNLAQEYGISKQQISDIRKNADKILKSTDSIDTSEGLKGIVNIHISIIWTLDYPDYLPRSRRVRISEIRLYKIVYCKGGAGETKGQSETEEKGKENRAFLSGKCKGISSTQLFSCMETKFIKDKKQDKVRSLNY